MHGIYMWRITPGTGIKACLRAHDVDIVKQAQVSHEPQNTTYYT